MPGISVHIDFTNSLNPKNHNYGKIINSILYNSEFNKQDLIDNETCYVFFTGYKEYPFERFVFNKYEVFVEGKLYGKNQSERESTVKELCQFFELPTWDNNVKSWLENVDGDFIIIIHNKTEKKLFFINDILGRLPVYIYRDKNKILISREMKFIYHQIYKEIDVYGLAEYLLLSQTLGTRTLLKNINYILPATVFCIDLSKSSVQIKEVIKHNFDNREFENIEANILVKDLKELFIQGIKNRYYETGNNILSLSGGFDSRAILGTLKNCGYHFKAVTFVGYNKTSEKDYKIAKLLTENLNIPWNLIEIGNPKGSDIYELLNYKDGTNSLWQSFLIIYCREIIKRYGRNTSFITGLGGNIVFQNNTPATNLTDVEGLVKYIISNKFFFTTKKISQILGIEEKDLVHHLCNHFTTYPEIKINNKYLHYITLERGGKWTNETEDKNRFFFWTVAPLYYYPFYNYAMNIPDKLKSGYFIYNKFISQIHPESIKYKHAVLGIPLNSKDIRYKLFMLVKDKIYPTLPPAVKRRLRMKLNELEVFKISDTP